MHIGKFYLLLIIMSVQAQYVDVYDSVLEHVVCGETKIDAVDLRVKMKTLRTVDQNTGQTAFEKQFQVMSRFHVNII
jgi:hypothetical protein